MTAKSTAISMTSPVSMEKSVGQWPVHFVMPRKHTPDTLPIPSNPAVKLREIPATNYAVLRFAGFAGETKVSAKTAGLKAWLKERDIEPLGNPELACYNPP